VERLSESEAKRNVGELDLEIGLFLCGFVMY